MGSNFSFAVAAEPEILTRPKIEYQAQNFRDPFEAYRKDAPLPSSVSVLPAPEEKVLPLPDLTIQGAIWGGSLPQAIINNRVLKLEEVIEPPKVVKIEKEGITVLYSGRQYNLSLPGQMSLGEKQGGKDEE